MPHWRRSIPWLRVIVGIILPAMLAVATLIGATYLFIIPLFKETFLDNKREMIKELVHLCWSIMELYEKEERAGRMSRAESQAKDIGEIEQLLY